MIKISRNYFILGKHLFVKCHFIDLTKRKAWWSIHKVNEPKYNFAYYAKDGKQTEHLFIHNGYITLKKRKEKYFAYGYLPIFYRRDLAKPMENI